MSHPHLKSQIHRDQLTWFFDLLLDEKEIFQLSASTGIIPDIDRLYALSRRELLANLTDAFLAVDADANPTDKDDDALIPKPETQNGEPSTKELASQFLTEKAHAAISRVGYMEVSEIETFFRTSDILIESGDFAEIVWALLIDQRTAVAEHGYKLLNTTYEAIKVEYTNGYENLTNHEQSETIVVQDTDNLEAENLQSENSGQEIKQLERQLADARSDYLSLEKRHSRLDQQRAFLLEENKGLKTKTEAYHDSEKRLKELEQENQRLQGQVAQHSETSAELQKLTAEREHLLQEKERLTEQLKAYGQIQAAKDGFAADLKSVEEAIYKGHQEIEEFQNSLDGYFNALDSCHQTARGGPGTNSPNAYLFRYTRPR